jgi:divalent metal cation (Fe/Co/Zn/Cd) transporter
MMSEMVMANNIVASNVFGGIIALIVIMLIGAFLWRMFRSSIRRDELIDAYFTAKLKNHAIKQNIDLEPEMKEIQGYRFWGDVAKNRAEAKQKSLNNSSIAKTDLLFEALNEKEGKK